MITHKMKLRIKRELSSEKPTVWVGKNGATKEIIEEISRQLEKKEMVKLRVLKSALESNEVKALASRITEQTGAELTDVRGHTIMLYKRRRREG